jgi:hypothetical protein
VVKLGLFIKLVIILFEEEVIGLFSFEEFRAIDLSVVALDPFIKEEAAIVLFVKQERAIDLFIRVNLFVALEEDFIASLPNPAFMARLRFAHFLSAAGVHQSLFTTFQLFLTFLTHFHPLSQISAIVNHIYLSKT